MDHERCEIVLSALRGEKLNLNRVRRFGAPHARAGGKDLQCICADIMSMDGGTFQRAGGAGMNANAHPASIATRARTLIRLTQAGGAHIGPLRSDPIQHFLFRARWAGFFPA